MKNNNPDLIQNQDDNNNSFDFIDENFTAPPSDAITKGTTDVILYSNDVSSI